MNLWELTKKGAEEGREAVRGGVSVFMAEAGKTSKMLRKGMQLTSVQSRVRKAFIRLGSLVYELHSKGEKDIFGKEEVKNLIAEIDDYEVRVREIAAEIGTIKREDRRKTPEKTSETEDQPPMPHY